MAKQKRLFTILTLAVALILLAYYTWPMFPHFSQQKHSEAETIFQSFDILAHPERYPVTAKHFSYNVRLQAPEPVNATLTTYNDSWREVSSGVFVHSAYRDVRTTTKNTVVRVMGLVDRKRLIDFKLKCGYKRNNATVFVQDYAAPTTLHEQHNSTYLGVFFLCFFKNMSVPSEIVLGSMGNDTNSQWLEVHRTEPTRNGFEISVCVKPIYGRGNDLLPLAEFLAFYSVVGVKTFTFYDYEIFESTKGFLKSVVAEEIEIRLVNWSIPATVAKQTWQNGQMASIQDCLFRSRDFRFVLIVDLDEYLVPRQHFSLEEMMEELLKVSKRKIGSFIFRHSYFCRPNSLPVNDEPLVTSTWTNRERDIWPAKERSKIIATTAGVAEAGIHFAWRHWKGWKPSTVPWQLALLHHYSKDGCKSLNTSVEEDRTAESYKMDVLFSRPMIKYRKLRDSNNSTSTKQRL